MDDPSGQDVGYTPAQYAFMLLRAEPVGNSMVAATSDRDAADIMAAATRDLCPRHTRDLPPAWIGSTTGTPAPSTTVDALTLATAIGNAGQGLRKADIEPVNGWAGLITNIDKFLKVGNDRSGAIDFLQHWVQGSEHTAATLVDSIGKGIVAAPAQVQTAMDAVTA